MAGTGVSLRPVDFLPCICFLYVLWMRIPHNYLALVRVLRWGSFFGEFVEFPAARYLRFCLT